MNIIILYFAIKYKGDWDEIYSAFERKEKVTLEQIKEVEKRIQDENWKYITILDAHYPNELKKAYKPPFVIWYKGDITLMNKKVICLEGNDHDEFSRERINKFVPEITKKHIIVNNSYKGVDEEICKSQSSIIYILANGIDNPYLNSKVKENDLLITEYPPKTKATKENFRNRNRLVAAIAKSLILFTSEKDGPINNLITEFLNQGKEIYCFPGDGSDRDGNSELIKQGANLITGIKDIS